jgi:hypothetical protein
MKASVLAHSALSWPLAAPMEIVRPASIDAGAWRRFSRVARLAAAAVAPVLEAADLDRDELPLFFGTGLGEYSSSYGFLKSLFTRGAAMASPLYFQNSVHNAGAGHLSIAFSLRGPSETLCAGALTTLRTFERALCWLEANGGHALVVLADDVTPESAAGWALGGIDIQPGEGGAAFLLSAAALAPGRASIELVDSPSSPPAGRGAPEGQPQVLPPWGPPAGRGAPEGRRGGAATRALVAAMPFFCTSDAHPLSVALSTPGEHTFDYPGCMLVARSG